MEVPMFKILTRLTPLILLSIAIHATAGGVEPSRKSLEKVPVDPALIDVGDGDTVVIRWGDDDAERIRILGIDTPEVAHHSMGWYDDQPYGPEATAFAEGVFAMAETVELLRAGEPDGYGRTLGYLFVNGRNYSVLAVKAGYAVETVSHYGDNGLPEEAEAVLAASRTVGPVAFEAPYRFRKRMRELNEWRTNATEDER
jgi:endonuclease YncB( thermonuclease family)